jgi:hypothetical protein
MRNLLFSIALIVVVFSFLNSQNVNSSGRFFGGSGYFSFGVSFLSLDKLNQVLGDNNRAQFQSSFLNIGGGGYGVLSKVMIGGEGFGILSQKRDKENFRSVLSGGYGFFNLGYIIYDGEKLRFYPMVGIGGGGLNLKIFEMSEVDFKDAVKNPKKIFDASFSSLSVKSELGVEYKIGRRYGGWMLGLKVGYVFSPVVGDWKLGDEVVLRNGPEVGINGFYLRLNFGGYGGGIRR